MHLFQPAQSSETAWLPRGGSSRTAGSKVLTLVKQRMTRENHLARSVMELRYMMATMGK